MIPNVYHEVLDQRQETISYWEGECHLLAYTVSCSLEERGRDHRLVWLCADTSLLPKFSLAGPTEWRFHVVIEVDDLIHDPWLDAAPVPIVDYLNLMFPDQDVSCVRGKFSRDDLRKQASDENWSVP